MPARARASGVSIACDVSRGSDTSVSTPPRLGACVAMVSARRNRSAARAPPFSSTATIPPSPSRMRLATSWSGCDASPGWCTAANCGCFVNHSATASAVWFCRATRTPRVFIPRSISHAAIGSRAWPHTCSSLRTSSITDSLPATAPASTSSWPFRYLVAL